MLDFWKFVQKQGSPKSQNIQPRVKVAGQPPPTVRFFFDEERFISDPPNGVTITSESDRHMLMLEDANPDDSGNYSCVARNNEGHQIETYCKVLVTPNPPQITYAPEVVNAYYGEPFSIEIETDAQSVKWDYSADQDRVLILKKKIIFLVLFLSV